MERKMTADERRLLDLLAESEGGCTDALLREHGITLEVMANMVRAGFATVHCDRAVEFTRVWITDAGRLALAG
jgi:hypothetical protein